MAIVTVSSKYQVVIPKKVREPLGIKAGDQLDAISYRGGVALLPVRSVKAARGFLRGMDTNVPRDPDRT